MKNLKRNVFGILLAFTATIALAAAGDRFIENTTVDKDIFIQVNDGGVKTSVLKANGAVGKVEPIVRTDSACGIGNVCSGTYNPTATGGTNVSAITIGTSNWTRIGNMVIVGGNATITTTSGGGTYSTFTMTLPVASNIASFTEVNGTGTYQGAAGTAESYMISGETSLDRAIFESRVNSTAARNFEFLFMYPVN